MSIKRYGVEGGVGPAQEFIGGEPVRGGVARGDAGSAHSKQEGDAGKVGAHAA